MILTDGRGRPLESPPAPGPDATIDERIAWLRADSAHRDRVTNLANRAFADAFRRGVRVGRSKKSTSTP